MYGGALAGRTPRRAAASPCAPGSPTRAVGAGMSMRVLLVDDQALIRAGFRMILEAEEDIEVVGEGADGTRRSTASRGSSPTWC